MEAEVGTDEPDLIQALHQSPHLYSFFQVVQLLEKYLGARCRIGGEGAASDEVLRLRPYLSLAFPRADVIAVTPLQDAHGRDRRQVDVTFLGLYGSNSPLPYFYNLEIVQDQREDALVRGFLDVFHHRMLSLYYRAWEKYRHYVQYEPGARDRFSTRTYCLLGLAFDLPAKGVAIPAERVLKYAGLLLQKPCSAEAVRRAVSDYFGGLPTQVTQCVPRWVNIPADSRCRLGSANCRLGEDLYAGEQILDRSGKFRITIGAVGLETFVSFLPGEESFAQLNELKLILVRDRLQYELEVILRHEEIPDLVLRQESMAVRMGQTTWLGTPGGDAPVVFEEPAVDAVRYA